MIRQYLTSLEKQFGYTGNWHPDSPVEVGSYIPLENGLIGWLKSLLGIHGKAEILNGGLHDLTISQIKQPFYSTLCGQVGFRSMD